MATTQRNFWMGEGNYQGGFTRNRESGNYGGQKDYNNYDEYNNYEDEDEDRTFKHIANYNDYEDDFDEGFNRHEYASSEEGRNQPRAYANYQNDHNEQRRYGTTNRNGRTIEGENGGNENYNDSDYTPRYNSNCNNLNFGSYGNRTDNSNRRLNSDYSHNRETDSRNRSYDNDSKQQYYSDNDFNNRPFTRRMYDGSLSLRRTDGRGFARTSNSHRRDDQNTYHRN